MFKYTTNTLKKIEDLYKEAGYVVRYEKGNFNSGYCILENKKVVVVNKYFTTEARINCLVDILGNIEVDKAGLSETSRTMYAKAAEKNPQSWGSHF